MLHCPTARRGAFRPGMAFHFVDADGDAANEFFEEGPDGALVRQAAKTFLRKSGEFFG